VFTSASFSRRRGGGEERLEREGNKFGQEKKSNSGQGEKACICKKTNNRLRPRGDKVPESSNHIPTCCALDVGLQRVDGKERTHSPPQKRF